MELYEKNAKALYVLNVLRKYTDENHILKATEIRDKIEELYKVDIDTRTVKRIINLLKYKEELGYDISTQPENRKGYFLYRDPDTDFEPGEIRTIIDTFNYSNYIEKSIADAIIKKCKNLQNIYENQKLSEYKIYANDTKTDNKEVLMNIEDIQEAIYEKAMIEFEYWKYELNPTLKKEKVGLIKATPYAIVYNLQQFYLIALKQNREEMYVYRIDRIKNVNRLNQDGNYEKFSDKEIEKYIKSNVSMFSGNPQEVEAKCKMNLLDNVIELYGKEVKINRINDEYFKVTFNANIEGIKYWALRNIREVEILKPLSLRKELKEILETESKKY